MGKVVAFDRPHPAQAAASAKSARPPRRFAARLGWWALGGACAAAAAILAALRPFIMVFYWFGVFFGVLLGVLGGWLLVPHVRMDHVYQGAALFFGALILRHGSDGLVRGLRTGVAYCDARR